jgi:hypothetical protein
MRLLDCAVPGDPPASCVVFFFGPGGGGGVDANLERWEKQFQSSRPARRERLGQAKDVRAHLLDVQGTYVAETRPGSGERVNEQDWRLLAAVLEVPGGPLYLKLVGPRATVDDTESTFRAWIATFEAGGR